MNNFKTVIRNSAKAIIIRNDCLLLVRISDESGEWHVLPGGGQKPGELLSEDVRHDRPNGICGEIQVASGLSGKIPSAMNIGGARKFQLDSVFRGGYDRKYGICSRTTARRGVCDL